MQPNPSTLLLQMGRKCLENHVLCHFILQHCRHSPIFNYYLTKVFHPVNQVMHNPTTAHQLVLNRYHNISKTQQIMATHSSIPSIHITSYTNVDWVWFLTIISLLAATVLSQGLILFVGCLKGNLRLHAKARNGGILVLLTLLLRKHGFNNFFMNTSHIFTTYLVVSQPRCYLSFSTILFSILLGSMLKLVCISS